MTEATVRHQYDSAQSSRVALVTLKDWSTDGGLSFRGPLGSRTASLYDGQTPLVNNEVRKKFEVLQGATNSCLGRRVAADMRKDASSFNVRRLHSHSKYS